MKNKFQQKICAMFQRTYQRSLHIFSTLCVSLKRDNNTENKIENDFLNSEYFKRNPDLKKMYLKQKNGDAVYGTKVTPINTSNRRLII